MKIKINVTKKDISNGVVGDVAFCPIAQAFGRVFKRVDYIDVNELTADITLYGNYNTNTGGYEDDTNFGLKLPSKAGKFVNKFDHEEDVEPFSFNVSLTKKAAEVLKPSKKYVVAA